MRRSTPIFVYLSLIFLLQCTIAAPMKPAGGPSTSTSKAPAIKPEHPAKKLGIMYDGKKPEDPEFGCVEATSADDPEKHFADSKQNREGTQGIVIQHPDNGLKENKEDHIVIKSHLNPDKLKRRELVSFMHEIAGLRRAGQFNKCLYKEISQPSGVAVKRYYLFMKRVPGVTLPSAHSIPGFEEVLSLKAKEADVTTLVNAIKAKARWYARTAPHKIGHKDLPNCKNIKIVGKDLHHFTIDFVDWAQWDDTTTEAGYEAYDAWLEKHVLPSLVKNSCVFVESRVSTPESLRSSHSASGSDVNPGSRPGSSHGSQH